MAEKIKPSERSHPLYTENINNWELYKNAAKGGEDFINEDNLFTHRLEDAEDYDERLDRAYYLNFCDSIPKIFNSYIFRNNIERPPNTDLDAFRNNVDGKGTNIADFIKLAGYYAAVYGVVHIFVDMPESKKKNPTIADMKNEGVSPYCTLIHPTELKDFSVDEFGNFRWIILEYNYYRDLDPEVEREEETHYKVITTEKWYVLNEEGEKVKFEEDGRKSEGQNKLKFIPIITLYNADGEDDKIGESLLKDIVRVNRIIMNWCSCIDEQVERQTFSQLTMPDDEAMDEDEERGQEPLMRVSTSSIFTFNPESRHPPAFISPDTENINIIWKLVVDHVKEIFRLSGLQGGTSDLYTSRSGRQSQMNFKGVNAALAEKAMTYQKCENAISKLALHHLGKKDSKDYDEVKYPKTFDIVALGEELEGIISILERNFSETLNKTIMKDIARKTVPMAPESIRTQIEDEIDAGDGIVEMKGSPFEADAEKGGDGNTNSNQGDSFKTKDKLDKEETSHRLDEE